VARVAAGSSERTFVSFARVARRLAMSLALIYETDAR